MPIQYTVSSQNADISFAIQPDIVGEGVAYDHTLYDWHRLASIQAAFGAMQDQRIAPLQIGGSPTPPGTFKAGRSSGGMVAFHPTAYDNFGLLLLATMGNVCSLLGKNNLGVTTTGVNTHIFRFDPANALSLPWTSFRRVIHGTTEDAEICYDVKIGGISFALPGAGKPVCQMAFLGRDFTLSAAAGWVYDDSTYEDFQYVPDVGSGTMMIGGEEFPVLSAELTIDNGLTPAAQQMVIGRWSPHDIASLTRASGVVAVVKYQNDDFYRKVYTNSANGTTWTATPYITSGEQAMDLTMYAPINIGATIYPYSIRIKAGRVAWSVDGPPQLAPGGFIVQRYTGTFITPLTGDYLQIMLENGIASYPLPV